MGGFGIGKVIGASLRVWRQNFLPFTFAALVIYLPAFALRFAVDDEDLGFYAIPIDTLLQALIEAVVTYGVIMELHGTRPSYRACVGRGFAELVPVIGVVALSTLAILGATIFLVIPGLIVSLMLYVVVPVAIIERPGMMASLRRSRELTEGYKGGLFVLLLIYLALAWGVEWSLRTELSADLYRVAGVGVEALLSLFGALTAAVAYTELRQEKEGVAVPQIAQAFARIRPGAGSSSAPL